MKPNELLRRLKSETTDLHHEAERYVAIFDPATAAEAYPRYLARMLGFHGPVERRFARHAALEQHGFDAPDRVKSHLLADDLRALGWSEAEVAAVAPCESVPSVADTCWRATWSNSTGSEP